MSTIQKPQRAFLAVTLLTVIAITTVFMVYAALLATYTGPNVSVQSMSGEVQYSLTNEDTSFSSSPISPGNGSEWYARVYLATPPTQNVKVVWTLENQTGGTWNNPQNVTAFTSPTIGLTSSTYYIYAFSSGENLRTNNYNWGQHTTTAGTYRIVAKIYTV